jgi:hypothetical protein
VSTYLIYVKGVTLGVRVQQCTNSTFSWYIFNVCSCSEIIFVDFFLKYVDILLHLMNSYCLLTFILAAIVNFVYGAGLADFGPEFQSLSNAVVSQTWSATVTDTFSM